MSPNNSEKCELCSAGKVLEVKVTSGFDCMKATVASMDKLFIKTMAEISKNNKEVADALKQLTVYSVRDKLNIDALEKAKICKQKQLDDMGTDIKKMNENLVAHLGEHKGISKESRKNGAIGGLGVFAVIEFIKQVISRF